MSIWNKVLVGLICVASLAFFYMAARTLKTHQHWRELARKYDRKIEQVRADNQRLIERDRNGPAPQLGIRQLRIELSKLLLDRRRAWFKCDPKVKLNAQDGTAVGHGHHRPARSARHRRQHDPLRLRRGRRAEEGTLPGRVQGDEGRREAEDGDAGSHLAA